MSFVTLVVLYVLLRIVLPLVLKSLNVKNKSNTSDSFRERQDNSRLQQILEQITRQEYLQKKQEKDLDEAEEDNLVITHQPQAKSKLVVADAYSMEDLDHDESQHQTVLQPETKVTTENKRPWSINGTSARQGFIMAEILGKPKALQD